MISRLDFDLLCELDDGRCVTIQASDRQVVIVVPDLPTAERVLSAGRSLLGNPKTRTRLLNRVAADQISVELMSAERTLAGFGGQSGLVARMFGFPATYISARLLALLVLRQLTKLFRKNRHLHSERR